MPIKDIIANVEATLQDLPEHREEEIYNETSQILRISLPAVQNGSLGNSWEKILGMVEKDGKLAFLDVVVTRRTKLQLEHEVFRKPTYRIAT